MDSQTIDQLRYRRILRFFAGMIAHIVWWDLAMSRMPIARRRALASRPDRLGSLAREFRALAIEMGGVMIKLGQFLSSRVDVLPLAVTAELQGLQDEVPPADSRLVLGLLSEQLGDLSRRFEYIEPQPIAAASLGQVYRARLIATHGEALGEQVVIKVQRPRIEQLVRTDLAALRVVARWVMRYKPIRKRANVPALIEEFARTLWEELDYEAEADNAARFAEIHADNPRIYIPRVYRNHSTARVVVLEDVEALKIADVDALSRAGIEPKEVAELLLEAYFKQIFVAEFFHADPHPGNLFVRPRPLTASDLTAGAASAHAHPFQLIFVDFGMAVRMPRSVSENLRKVLIGVTQRDPRQLTEAYRDLGFFLPGADLDRITEAQEAILSQIWGRNLLDLAQPDPREVEAIGREFRDLLYEFPFQIPQDFIYLGRALGMLSGLVSRLDPQINPWRQIERYGQQLIRSQNFQHLRDTGLAGLVEMLRPFLDTPFRMQRLLEEAEKGRLRVQLRSDRDAIKQQERLEKRIGQLGWSIVSAAGILSATLLYLENRREKRNRQD